MCAILKTMNTISKKLSEITPYEHNSRSHDDVQITRLANSIKDFGFNQPIVLDKSNVIIVGHGRYFAAKKLGLESVPCIVKENLNEEQIRAYRILDNKLQNDSTWELENLELELGLLEEGGFALEPWGLDTLLTNKIEEEIEAIDPSQLESQFRIEVICMSENHQQKIYERLKEEGLNCRLLTL